MLLDNIKAFIKRPAAIKAFLFIVFYFLIMFVIVDYALSPLFKNICENIYNKPFDDIPKKSLYLASAVFDLIIYIILIIPLLVGYQFELQYDFFHAISDKKTPTFFLTSLGIFYVATVIAGVISMVIYKENQSVNQESIETVLKSGYIAAALMFITAVIIGPIVEELIFRQAMFDIFINKYVSIIISSLLFASIHIVSSSGSLRYMVSITIPYLTSGIVFGTIYEKSHRNIWLSIAVHATSNFIALVLVLA